VAPSCPSLGAALTDRGHISNRRHVAAAVVVVVVPVPVLLVSTQAV